MPRSSPPNHPCTRPAQVTPNGLSASETCKLLAEMHSGRASGAPEPELVAEHLRWVEAQAGCVGTSDHGLLFSQKGPALKPMAGGAVGGLLATAGALAGVAGALAGAAGALAGAVGAAGRQLQGVMAGGSGQRPMPGCAAQPLSVQEARVAALLAQIEQLNEQKASCEATLLQLGPRLPDGGSKVGRAGRTRPVTACWGWSWVGRIWL